MCPGRNTFAVNMELTFDLALLQSIHYPPPHRAQNGHVLEIDKTVFFRGQDSMPCHKYSACTFCFTIWSVTYQIQLSMHRSCQTCTRLAQSSKHTSGRHWWVCSIRSISESMTNPVVCDMDSTYVFTPWIKRCNWYETNTACWHEGVLPCLSSTRNLSTLQCLCFGQWITASNANFQHVPLHFF